MHHLLAFSSAPGNVSTYTQVNAVADQLYTRQNNEYQVPVRSWIPWYAGGCANGTAMRLFTPSLRLRGNPQVVPLGTATFLSSYPQYVDMSENPLQLVEEENLRVEVIHPSSDSDIARCFVAVAQRRPTKNINYPAPRWVRATTSVTAVAEGWSSLGALVFDDVLEGGSYAVYGMNVVQSTVLASRLVFQNQHERPGCLGCASVNDIPMPLHSMMELGLLGVFDTYSPPQLECFASAGGGISPVVWLAVSKADGFQPPFRGQ